MPHNAAFHLGLHCLPKTHLGVASIQRVNKSLGHFKCNRVQTPLKHSWCAFIRTSTVLTVSKIRGIVCLSLCFTSQSSFFSHAGDVSLVEPVLHRV